jgi:hypothetical protein
LEAAGLRAEPVLGVADLLAVMEVLASGWSFDGR